MTPTLAYQYIARRMRELGYQDRYHLRMRHLIIARNQIRTLKGYGRYFILVHEPEGVRITSQRGIFDLNFNAANELQYEHHGKIKILNKLKRPAHVKFIQVIPYKK